jgi:MFS family permease
MLTVSLSGAFSATWAITFAFVSDLEPRREERLKMFSYLMATLAVSLVIAPGLGVSHHHHHHVDAESYGT